MKLGGWDQQKQACLEDWTLGHCMVLDSDTSDPTAPHSVSLRLDEVNSYFPLFFLPLLPVILGRAARGLFLSEKPEPCSVQSPSLTPHH